MSRKPDSGVAGTASPSVAGTPGTEIEVEPKRDVRVDRVGLIGELWSLHAEPLVKQIKARHTLDGTRLEGDFFAGLIVCPNKRSLMAEDWVDLYDKGKISKQQFLRGIRVSATEAEKILDEKTFGRLVMSREETAQLRTTRIKRVERKVIDAVKRMNDGVDDEIERMVIEGRAV